MGGLVSVLCAVTALACGALLLRGFRRSGSRLLLWCGLFFVSLTLENTLLFVDSVHMPDTDLVGLRTSVALAGVALLLVGLIRDVA